MRNWNNSLDILGFSASFLCALHCIAMPLVAAFGLSGALPWLESEILEMALIVSTLIIAGWSLVTTFRQHGDRRPLWYAGLGFIVIIGGHLAHLHIEHYLAALGGVSIAYAHYLNWTLIGQCATDTKAFSLRPKSRAKRKVA